MKATQLKPATPRLGRRFLQLTTATLSATVLLFGATASAGPNEQWAATIGIAPSGNISPSPRVLAIDGSGASYIVGYGDTGAGTAGQAYVVKVDAFGNFVWLSNLSSGGVPSFAQFTDGVIDSSGDVVATGFVDDPVGSDVWVNIKLDPTTGAPSAAWPDLGDGVGIRILSSPGVNLRGSRIEPFDLTGPGMVISGASDTLLMMAAFDSSGNPSASWASVGYGLGIRAFAPSGGVVDITAPVLVKKVPGSLTGNYTLAGTGVFNTTGLDYIVTNWTPAGSLAWLTKYSPANNATDRLFDLQVDANGHSYVTGESFDLAANRFEMATLRLNAANGARAWGARTNYRSGGMKIALTGTFTVVAGYDANLNTMNVWKYNATGGLASLSWPAGGGQPGGFRRLGGTVGDAAEDIWIDGNFVYATGKVWDGGVHKMTTWQLNTTNGNTNWIERFGTFPTDSSGMAIKSSGGGLFGTVIGTGIVHPTGGGPDSLVVIRYTP
jgi:hypothetical protein